MFDLDHKGHLTRTEAMILSECIVRGLAMATRKTFKGGASFRSQQESFCAEVSGHHTGVITFDYVKRWVNHSQEFLILLQEYEA